MRALHLVKTSVGATWAYRQMRELVKLGVDVHVALPDGPLVSTYREAGVTTHLVPPKTLSMTSARRLREVVAALVPDVIHSHFVGTTLLARFALPRRGVPRIFQVPGPLHLEHRFFRAAEIGAASRRDYWIASCEWTRQRYIRSGIDPSRVFLSFYGTDLERFEQSPLGVLRDELGEWAHGAFLIGMMAFMYAPKRYLGQKRGIKGHEDLIDAVAIASERRPDLKVVFIGGAWAGATAYEQSIHAYASARLGDRARFLGSRTDVPQLYPDLDLVVHPSRSENIGGAGESLLAARPTITTEVGGFPDVVRPGVTGWLVPAKSPRALADAIIEAASDPKRATEMGVRGRALVLSAFDVRKTAGEVAAIYEQVLR